jgi:hypothetical protein
MEEAEEVWAGFHGTQSEPFHSAKLMVLGVVQAMKKPLMLEASFVAGAEKMLRAGGTADCAPAMDAGPLHDPPEGSMAYWIWLVPSCTQATNNVPLNKPSAGDVVVKALGTVDTELQGLEEPYV